MKIYSEFINILAPSKCEVLRYMRAGKDITGELDKIIYTSIDKVYSSITPRVCYIYLPLEIVGENVILGDMLFKSSSLSKRLAGCHKACVFAATVGTDVDRAIRASGAISSVFGLAADASGTAAVEELCDEFCRKLKEKSNEDGECTTSRFSAGYGDLSIEYQKDIINLLQTKKHIGVSLSVGGMMTPTKTVTAIVGIKNKFLQS